MSGLLRRRMRRRAEASMLASDHFVERRCAAKGAPPPFIPRVSLDARSSECLVALPR